MNVIKEELSEEQRRQNVMALGEKLLASKRLMQKEMREAHKNDPCIRNIIQNLKQKNARVS